MRERTYGVEETGREETNIQIITRGTFEQRKRTWDYIGLDLSAGGWADRAASERDSEQGCNKIKLTPAFLSAKLKLLHLSHTYMSPRVIQFYLAFLQ